MSDSMSPGRDVSYACRNCFNSLRIYLYLVNLLLHLLSTIHYRGLAIPVKSLFYLGGPYLPDGIATELWERVGLLIAGTERKLLNYVGETGHY